MITEYLLYGYWAENLGRSLLAIGVNESKEFDHTILYRGNSHNWELDYVTKWSSSGLNTDRENNWVILGEDGEFAIGKNENYKEGVINNTPTTTGLFKINDSLYATAMSSKIFRYIGNMTWVTYMDGIKSKKDHFTCMDGNHQIKYVAGWGGVCYWNTDGTWNEEVLPTNSKLTGLTVAEGGLTIICGFSGCLIVGEKGSWELIKHDYMLDDFWSILIGNDGKYYIAGNQAIYELTYENEWLLTPILGWPLEEKGLFSDMFFEADEFFWVLSEKGMFYRKNGEWSFL